jgi:hypothetical protein
MSAGFRAVQWNRAKLVYDAILVAGVTLYIAFFIAIGRWWLSPPDDPARWEDLGIRAFGTCAFLSRGSTGVSCRCSTTGAISAC